MGQEKVIRVEGLRVRYPAAREAMAGIDFAVAAGAAWFGGVTKDQTGPKS